MKKDKRQISLDPMEWRDAMRDAPKKDEAPKRKPAKKAKPKRASGTRR